MISQYCILKIADLLLYYINSVTHPWNMKLGDGSFSNGRYLTTVKSVETEPRIRRNHAQSNLSYEIFQGNSEIWSHKTGGCLIQV